MTETTRSAQFQLEGSGVTLVTLSLLNFLAVTVEAKKPNLSDAVCKSSSKPTAVQHVMVRAHAALGRPTHRADPEPF